MAIPGLIAALVSFCAPTHAAELRDGHELLRFCTATIGAYVDYCYGYLDAVADRMLAGDAVAGFAACITDTTDDSALRYAFVAFLNDHGWVGKLRATEVVARAFADRFPCRQ